MKGTLKVLLWKHLVVRIRRFIQTPIEIISPAILFITLFCFKDYLLVTKPSHYNDFNVQQTEPVELHSVSGPHSIFYTPQTDLTSLLMNKVAESLAYKDKYSNAIKKPKITPALNESELEKFSKEIEEGVAFVLFQNISGTWPQKFHYVIRMKDAFKTYTYRSSSGDLGPHDYFGTVYESFMKLQWSIDKSYLELLTGNEIAQRVTLQEFPYARTNEDQMAKVICSILMALSWISLMLVFVFLMARLLEERVTGIQELIKMVGVSNNVLGLSHVLNVVPAGLVYAVVASALVTATSNPILPDTNPVLIFIMLALHYITVVALAFCSSYIANNTQYTETLAVLAYVLLYLPVRLLESRDLPRWTLALSGLLPHVPMHWFWDEVAALQQYGVGLSFATIASSHSPNSGSVLACYLCFIVQAVLYFGLAWYLAKVRPGPYGQAAPWDFLCQKQYWSKKKVTPEEHEELEELEEINYDPQYFEPSPKDMEVGIKIVNVSKMFAKHRALSEVSLDVYKGEITVLLGHNGAGKTTLMSIITGMLQATDGNVYVEGLDTVTQRDEMQRILGLCPQHNLFFPDLTVLEHVMFFTLLKGTTYAEAKKTSRALLEQLGIANKASYKSSELSGGMKRRLQLACALAGDAKVLVLDEPTSGLDVETRRELWDLLLSLRGSRTVLLSTHFMEEAEALGDRVAALHAGRLRCHATTMHLKRALGTGYRLSFTTIGLPDEPAITSVITSKIPEATVKETSLNSISYNLPSKSSDKFPKLFTLLESKRSELGIDSIGVGISTLEEVFLKLCSDVTTAFSEDAVDGENTEPDFKTMTGPRLYFHQLCALIMRQMKYLWSKKISFLIVQILIPIIMICGVTVFTNNSFINGDGPSKDTSINLDLNLYDKMADRRVLYNPNIGSLSLVKNKYPMVHFETAPDVAAAVLRTGQRDIFEYNKYLVGIELNRTHATVLFTTVVRHAAPVALNLLTNIIATQLLPYSDGQTVTTNNYPIGTTSSYPYKLEHKELFATSLWAGFVVFVTLTTVVNAVSLACKERTTGARHLHVLSGCPRALHWAATLLAHAAVYALVLVLPAALAALALDQDRTIDQPDFLGALSLILILGIISFLAVIYIVSFSFEERGSSIVLVAIVFIFGFFTPTVKSVSDSLAQPKSLVDYLLLALSYSVPPHTLTASAVRCAHVAAHNAYKPPEPMCYFCVNDNSPGGLMLVMFAQFIFYMSAVVATEYGLFNVLCDRVLNARYQPAAPVAADEMVRAEKAYVEKAIALPRKQIQDAMLVSDVHKKYWRLLGKPCTAVKGVSFSVKKGECFGLLGVNGAGKSTIFKMLTGAECATRGSIFANGHFMSKFSTDYLRSLGYCPQFFGLDGFLTGYDNLKLLLTLRGLEPADVKSETKAWIDIVGLDKYARRAVAGYSGGCARRLAAAAALCRGGAVTLLDEPTAGVDVAARRRVWAALRRTQPRRALVVTSHSMDEMEALCGRLAIVARGRVVALGGAAALRAAHAAGHAVLLKLRAARARDETDSSKSDVNRLKAALQQRFNCTLRDEHKTMLHYHINDTMRYSDLFSELEQLRQEFPLLEDYSVTETTLEEVFLSFAKEEPKVGPTPV